MSFCSLAEGARVGCEPWDEVVVIFLIRLCWRVRVGEMCVCVYGGLFRWTVEWVELNSLGKVLQLEQVQGKKGCKKGFILFILPYSLLCM